jgi:aryl-alcohol dehydrogenase
VTNNANSQQRQPIRAAVAREPGKPLQFETATLEAPRDNEVLVRMVATGVCHTDMVVRDQQFKTPLPMILGHEGAGVVEQIGRNVTTVAPGDHVVMTYMYCGLCSPCATGHPAHCANMGPLNFGGGRLDGSSSACTQDGGELHDHFFGQSSFATHAIASELNVVKVDKDVQLELLGPLGCGIQTGAGAVLNAMKVHAGSSFAAFGTGAVGLAAIMAARVAGATKIIAVDVNPARLKLALELGATHTDRAEPLAAAIRCSGAKPGVVHRHHLHSHVRRMALPGCGARSVFAPSHRMVHEFKDRPRTGHERLADGCLASPTDQYRDGAFGSRESIQQL